MNKCSLAETINLTDLKHLNSSLSVFMQVGGVNVLNGPEKDTQENKFGVKCDPRYNFVRFHHTFNPKPL